MQFDITNKHSKELRYSIYSIGWQPWIIFSYSQILLKPYEKKTISIFLYPDNSIEPGIYNLTFYAESYMDKISKHISIKINPRKVKDFTIRKFELTDNYILLIGESKIDSNLTIDIYKENILVKEIIKKINKGVNTIKEHIELKEDGTYTAKVIFNENGKELIIGDRKFIKKTKPNILNYTDEWNYLIISGKKITFKNVGDKSGRETYRLEIDKRLRPFLIVEGYKDVIEGDSKIVYTWDFVLLPNQSFTISYSYDYIILVLLIVLGGLFIVLLFLTFRKEIKIKKSIVNKIKKIKEGKDIKILLEVENTTNKELSHIIVEDFLPPLFELKESLLKPKIKKKTNEAILRWEIPKLEPKETRIFSYTIIPKLGLDENYSFPLARVIYKIGEIKKESLSNNLVVKVD
ncbi:MAG: hypothetical protein B6U88_01400 [Candidatus Aenigmarchaeota archaeon ex4484_56]|nr:MAG: hypothetical protein B6U88_01400 [Candidatus Aenigmarchaeota archaeon ex4484_56]